MDSSESYHVAIAPVDKADESLIKQVSAIVDKDLYRTRFILAGKIPRIIASYETAEMAESNGHRLKALGLVVIVCKDSELRESSTDCYRAHTMKLEEQAVLFRDRNDREMRVESTEVFLIIEGKLQARTEKEVETTTMKFSVPATILSGGIPVWRKVKEKKSASSLHSEFFMRLYNRMSAEPSVEILQYAFDYSFLAAEMAPNSVANFNTTVTKIRDSFPQAIFDDRLTAPFTIDILTTEPQDIVGIDCKLLYLYHRTVSNHSSSA